MPPKLQRSNTLRKLLLSKKDSIRITETNPVRWRPLGVQRSLYDDFTHLLFEWTYGQLFLFVASVYLAVITVFALLLYLSGCGRRDNFLAGESPPDMAHFEVCFWFSAVNVITTGFGAIVPVSRGAYLLSCVEHFVGLLMSSLLLGIIVSKASVPTAKLVFSNVAVVRKRFGVPYLIIRVGNGRGNFLYSPEIRLSYIRFRHTPEGETVHTESQLAVCDPVALKPVFFVQHALDESSPLHKKTQRDLAEDNGFIVLTISATDDMTLQTLHSRNLYSPSDIRWNHTFEDVIVEQIDHSKPMSIKAMTQISRGIDFARFHNTAAVSDLDDLDETEPKEPADVVLSNGLRCSSSVDGQEKADQMSCSSLDTVAVNEAMARLAAHKSDAWDSASSNPQMSGTLENGGAAAPLSSTHAGTLGMKDAAALREVHQALSVLTRLVQSNGWHQLLEPLPPPTPFSCTPTA